MFARGQRLHSALCQRSFDFPVDELSVLRRFDGPILNEHVSRSGEVTFVAGAVRVGERSVQYGSDPLEVHGSVLKHFTLWKR